jgi:hypothetical protein
MMPTNVPSEEMSLSGNHDFMDELHSMKVHLFVHENLLILINRISSIENSFHENSSMDFV